MRNLLDNLEEADMNFDQVVSTNVYLDDLSDAQGFDEVYAQYFSPPLPARSVVQQIAPAERKPHKDDHYPDLEQVSLIADEAASRNTVRCWRPSPSAKSSRSGRSGVRPPAPPRNFSSWFRNGPKTLTAEPSQFRHRLVS